MALKGSFGHTKYMQLTSFHPNYGKESCVKFQRILLIAMQAFVDVGSYKFSCLRIYP